MKQLLQEYTQYNVWANESFISIIQQLSPEQLYLQQVSSFESVRKTANHIADCEYNWLKRVNGNSLWEYKATLFGADIAAMLEFWISQSRQLADLVQKSEEDQLKQVITYRNIKGIAFENELYQVIMHIMNHSTYHRGQLVTLLRGAGFTALVNTDLISFYRR